MLKSLFRIGFLIGAASSAVYLFRWYSSSRTERAGRKVRSAVRGVSRDIGQGAARAEEGLSASLGEISRNAV